MDGFNPPSGLAPHRRALLERRLESLGLRLDDLDPQVRGWVESRAQAVDARVSVGRYLILRELGRGGMGVVYEAFDPGIERRVAIKTLEPDLVPEDERDEVIARFRRETKLIGRLEHPSIVTVFDFGIERTRYPEGGGFEDVHYCVMELLEGRSVARTLREDGPLPLRRAVEVARSIAEALDLSHRAGVIHRDVKPSNVFLRTRGEAVLLDFGIAKTSSVALTRHGQILGTPSYLAPERLQEKEVPIDGRADLFSLGALLFFMILGEAPFVGEDVYEVIDKIAEEAHPQLGGATPAARALESVVDRLLAKDPADRFSEASAVVRALSEVQAHLEAEARAPKPLDLAPRDAGELAGKVPRRGDDPIESATPSTASPGAGRLGEDPHPAAPEEGATTAVDEVASPALHGYGEPADLDFTTDGHDLDPRPGSDGSTRFAPSPRAFAGARSPAAADALPDDEATLSDGKSTDASDEPTVAEVAAVAPRGPRSRGRPRIEVSLVDEDDVVVRPLSGLGADEDPTQTGAGPPVIEPEVVVAEPEARPPSPSRSPAYAPPSPLPEPMSIAPDAAVDRRTFGVPPGPRSGLPGPAVSVRISGLRLDEGTDEHERRTSRQRWSLLVVAVLVSVGTGLALGRFLGPERVQLPEPIEPATAPVASAQVGKDRRVPRSARSLMSDAEAARNAGDLELAVDLYGQAAERTSADQTVLRASAHLGRADVLRGLGQDEWAAESYRRALQHVDAGPVAAQAKVALRELEAQARIATSKDEAAAAARPKPERKPARPARKSAKAVDPESSCRQILFRHVADPQAAVDAFEALARAHPRASCAQWNLGVKYESVGAPRRAARAYRTYLELDPETPRRSAVERRIQNLEARGR